MKPSPTPRRRNKRSVSPASSSQSSLYETSSRVGNSGILISDICRLLFQTFTVFKPDSLAWEAKCEWHSTTVRQVYSEGLGTFELALGLLGVVTFPFGSFVILEGECSYSQYLRSDHSIQRRRRRARSMLPLSASSVRDDNRWNLIVGSLCICLQVVGQCYNLNLDNTFTIQKEMVSSFSQTLCTIIALGNAAQPDIYHNCIEIL